MPAVKKKLIALEDEKAQLEPEMLALKDEGNVDPHPAAAEAYRRAIENLRLALSLDEAERLQVVEILRGIVQAIEIHPGSGRGKVEIKLGEP